MLRVIATWFSLAGLYLLLAAKLNWPEACVASLAATAGGEMIRRLGTPRTPSRQRTIPPAGWLGGILASVFTDGWRVMAALAQAASRRRRIHGSLDLIAFAAGDDRAPDAARRTWVTLGLSLAPATAAIAVDRPRQRILVHRLPPPAAEALREPTSEAPESLTLERLAEACGAVEASVSPRNIEWPT